jgi:hypothetical protein
VELVQRAVQEEVEKVTRNEIVQKNIALSFDFVRHIVKNPDLLQTIPDDGEVEFIEHDVPIFLEHESTTESEKRVAYKVEHIFTELHELRSGVDAINC